MRQTSQQPWQLTGERHWYEKSAEFWEASNVSLDGVLDGRPETSAPDLKESAAFLQLLRKSDPYSGSDDPVCAAALDCGAGIGRVTEGLLIHHCGAVDLLEPCAKLLKEARRRLDGCHRAAHFLQGSLQDLPALPDTYDLFWIQWVLLYLTDQDLVAMLHRLRAALRPDGVIVVKENCLMGSRRTGMVDKRDASLTRSDSQFRQLFDKAGFTVCQSAQQQDWPDSLLPVMMYALR